MFREYFGFKTVEGGVMGDGAAEQKPCVLGIGHPLLDIKANVDSDFLRRYKVDANGCTLKGPEQDGIYEELLEQKYNLAYVAGGSAQNTVRMIQWIFGDNMSSKCAYLGCIGNDKPGEILLQCMQDSGVQTFYEVSSDRGTGISFVLVNGINRSLITSLGAASALSTKFLRQNVAWDMVKAAHFYYIMGFLLVSSMDIVMLIADHAAALGKAICFNLAAPFVSKFFTDSVDKLLPYTDFIFGTGDEALAYAEARHLKDKTVEGVARHFAGIPRIGKSKRPRLIVFTEGPQSITAMSSEDKLVHVFPVTPLLPEEIADTNGAGDAFAAGFLSSYLVNGSLEEAVEGGKKAACYIIKQSGFCLGPRNDYDT